MEITNHVRIRSNLHAAAVRKSGMTYIMAAKNQTTGTTAATTTMHVGDRTKTTREGGASQASFAIMRTTIIMDAKKLNIMTAHTERVRFRPSYLAASHIIVSNHGKKQDLELQMESSNCQTGNERVRIEVLQ